MRHSVMRASANPESRINNFWIPGSLVSLAPRNDSLFNSAHPRRFAFTAIDSRARCAITAASGACLRISSAAVAS